MLKNVTIRATLLALSSTLSIAAYAFADAPKQVDIPAGDLSKALLQLSKQYGADLVYRPEQVHGFKTHGAHGELTTEQAATRLLEGTPLELRTEPSGAILIAPLRGNTPSDTRDIAPVESSSHGKEQGVGDSNNNSSDTFRLAQVDQGANPGSTSVEKTNQNPDQRIQLEQVIVTGSRIPQNAKEGTQEVTTYTRQQIEQSGQSSIVDFLSTLPDVSAVVSEQGQGFGAPAGITTIQLHGLPYGTTLVLINGRRLEASGASQGAGADFFDLTTIPLAAVERIEVVATGSSAIYGSDAIAGVVNIILKKNFDGISASVRGGIANANNQWDGSVAWGQQWEKGAASIVGSIETRSQLITADRYLTANQNYTQFGGPDSRVGECTPGNVFSLTGNPLPGAPAGSNAMFAAVTPNVQSGKPKLSDFTYGALNECGAFGSILPRTLRRGLFAAAHYDVIPSVQLFAEIAYSRTQQFDFFLQNGLFAVQGFQSFTASASNPFNPFGEAVGVGENLQNFPGVDADETVLDTTFVRVLGGLRGNFLGSWQWELAGWDSRDRTEEALKGFPNGTAIQNALNSPAPSTAINPFVAGPAGSPALLRSLFGEELINQRSETQAADFTVRGPIAALPSGALYLVVGGEIDHDTEHMDADISFSGPNAAFLTNFHRDRYALFTEARLPILGASLADPKAQDTLAVTVAGRYDKYTEFGSKTTPQFGVEWRPVASLLVRGTYGRAFKAPSLYQLQGPTFSGPAVVVDPLRGNQLEQVTQQFGSDPGLKAETGESHTFGFVYSSRRLENFRLSVSNWNIRESNSIQEIQTQALIENPALFPGRVVRASSCSGGPPCPIIFVNNEFVNFGQIKVEGLDYRIDYKIATRLGEWSPSLSATETYHFTSALTPGAPAIDKLSKANDDGVFAPRWKAVAALNWKQHPYTIHIDGRYIGTYQDYDSSREIGNFWYVDANARYTFGQGAFPASRWLKESYLEVGGVNIFNKQPQYSNYGFGTVGYDPRESDIRGRFLYAQVGIVL